MTSAVSALPTPAASLTESVRADLDAIFAEVGPLPAAGRAPEAAIHALRPNGAPKSRGVIYGAAAAAALAGVAIGAVVTHAAGPAPPPPPTATVRVAAAAPEIPAPAPIISAPSPVSAPVRSAEIAPATHEVRRAPARALLAACDGSRCDAQAVMAADRRLRRAYERAIDARVPRRVLVGYRDRWDSLRQADAERPAALVRGYDGLTSDLGRAARDVRPARAEAMDPPPLRWPLW